MKPVHHGHTVSASARTVRRAFTLIELLVVISVLVLLLAILLPSLSAARRHSKSILCLSNQRQIGMAMHLYADEYRDQFCIAQYFDKQSGAFVAWDTITVAESMNPKVAAPGLIWKYVDGGAVQQCPAYSGPSMTTGDPYTGYNYNTTYIGRGENEDSYRGMGEAPAFRSWMKFTAKAALIGDGGYKLGTNKFMRAPLDTGVSEGTVLAGAQAYRHSSKTNVVYIDGHGASVKVRFEKPNTFFMNKPTLGWPNNGFLSEDDASYAYR